MNKNRPDKFDPDLEFEDASGTDETVRFEDSDGKSRVPSDFAAAMSELEQTKQELADSEKRALIAAADLENFRKRANRNAQEQVRYANLPMMTGLLESVDNLNRAIDAAESDSDSNALLVGVKMVADQILEILKSNGCQPIAAVGQPFDPNSHEAIQMQPSDDFPANTVMKEIRTGYTLHDRVIRPAQVFISTGPATT